MGRGIDFKGVNLVINYDFPQSAVSYIHRIGKLILHKFTRFICPVDLVSNMWVISHLFFSGFTSSLFSCWTSRWLNQLIRFSTFWFVYFYRTGWWLNVHLLHFEHLDFR